MSLTFKNKKLLGRWSDGTVVRGRKEERESILKVRLIFSEIILIRSK